MRSNDPPDTSTITAAASDDTFIALADDAEPGIAIPTFNFGDGTAGVYTVQGGGEIEYENRELSGGIVYYFFIRLHSSVVSVHATHVYAASNSLWICCLAGCSYIQ